MAFTVANWEKYCTAESDFGIGQQSFLTSIQKTKRFTPEIAKKIKEKLDTITMDPEKKKSLVNRIHKFTQIAQTTERSNKKIRSKTTEKRTALSLSASNRCKGG